MAGGPGPGTARTCRAADYRGRSSAGNRALIDRSAPRHGQVLGKIRLAAKGLAAGRVADLTYLAVRAGEISAFAGLPGSGAEEADDILLVAASASNGADRCAAGKSVTFKKSARAKKAGVAFAAGKTASRKSLFAGAKACAPISRWPNLDDFISDARLRFILRGRERPRREPTSAQAPERQERRASRRRSIRLSGGNQQTGHARRWMAAAPASILLNSPTRLSDVGAKAGNL